MDDTISGLKGLESWVFSILGGFMAIIPLALWFSWTESIFYGLLLAWLAAYAGITIICGRSRLGYRFRR
ncbi:MAG: hypothetical protein JKY20_13220 [Alphaproteobacteria bacterium]|nr:hypothetical protein [Alphaproteobacteria bacterium]